MVDVTLCSTRTSVAVRSSGSTGPGLCCWQEYLHLGDMLVVSAAYTLTVNLETHPDTRTPLPSSLCSSSSCSPLVHCFQKSDDSSHVLRSPPGGQQTEQHIELYP